MFTKECELLFCICLIFDIMIVWSHQRASKGDPGFMEERYVSSYSDHDDQDVSAEEEDENLTGDMASPRNVD